MNPLKRKKISEQTAKQLNLPVELVDDITSFYYKYVQKKLSSLSSTAINVPNLGTFVLKEKSVLKKLDKYENAIARMEEIIESDKKFSMRKYESILDMRTQVDNFKNALNLIGEEKEKKKQKKKERKNYETESNTDMENEGQDS